MATLPDSAGKHQRNENRTLSTVAVLERLQTDAPDAFRIAEIVGRWVWIAFDAKPAADVRDTLKALGFSYNSKRCCWQHPCGHFCGSSPGNPRDRYGSIRAAAVLDDGKAVTA